MPPRAESIPALLGLFHPVFGLVEGLEWLPKDELLEVVTRDDASDRFIGGSVDSKAKTLTLLRGSIEVMVAPFSLFSKSGDGIAPDFSRLQITDHGLTIGLGKYEASADAILYELDPAYRRRLKNGAGRANRLSEHRSCVCESSDGSSERISLRSRPKKSPASSVMRWECLVQRLWSDR